LAISIVKAVLMHPGSFCTCDKTTRSPQWASPSRRIVGGSRTTFKCRWLASLAR